MLAWRKIAPNSITESESYGTFARGANGTEIFLEPAN